MNSLKMKIVGFDTLKGAVQIKFASDLADKAIDEYPSYDFNVVENDDSVILDDVLKALAQNGWSIALQQEIAETISKDNKKIELYKTVIGQEFVFTEDIFMPTTCPTAENQPLSTGLVII